MTSKRMQFLIAWGGALLGAGLLRWAGRHDLMPPQTLPLVLALVLGPPLAMGLWIASRWGRWSSPSENPADSLD
ncbi:MAG: hypothetical protein RLZZ158_1517 [Cyanobacteriota bacterium]|jgi:hypothetical protein